MPRRSFGPRGNVSRLAVHSRHLVDRLNKKNYLWQQVRGALRADRPLLANYSKIVIVGL